MENERVKPTPPSTRVIKEGAVPPRGGELLSPGTSINRKLTFYAFASGVLVLIAALLPTRTIFQGVVTFVVGVAVFVFGFGFGCWYEVQRALQKEQRERKPKEKKSDEHPRTD
jgi:hypothetical protein